MKTCINRLLLAAALAGGAAQAFAAGVDYRIDPEHTEVVVTWSHLGFSTPSAHAGGIQGVVRYDAANLSASSVKLDVPLTNFTSHIPKLDEMLRGPEFFEAGKYPAIGFESTSVEDKGNGLLLIHGKLRIKDREKPVVLEARQNKAGVHPRAQRPAIGFDASTVVKRSDFGVDAYAPGVSDDVALRITVEALADAAR
ncbi:Protein YceI [Achromobacter veterisilvae]|jgi:polyisoprenoid-binding protein YceI|uniref:Protein YceI n=1 Tax=Achromobacter veterisilvae TaxID=2069367 RepID=A0A446C3C1_9BURK|nr:YceI family protein [Achromobacter veterisilvae]SSW62335.1 Protein YceI [Achromobacter veterisilvae]